jgi:hypothetical protein
MKEIKITDIEKMFLKGKEKEALKLLKKWQKQKNEQHKKFNEWYNSTKQFVY